MCDNGVGFPGDLDFRRTEFWGLQLVASLVDQLRDTVNHFKKGGSKFRIIFLK